MDMGLLRSIMTVVLLAAFLGIVVWAWSARRREDFEAAAMLAVEDEDARAGERR